MRSQGPDCALAWCVALAACFINFVTAGIGRMSGIMYVAFIDIFGVSRALATAPFSIRSSIRNLLGPAVGILAQYYGIRAVIVVGAVIGLFSSASCYFANDINWIIIVWGGINGMSVACTSTLPQVVIGQYFDKYLTTAAGLAISGGCVGSFVFPALIEFLLHYYGLQGTFLLMAGISMHVIPAAMLLRKPPWIKAANKAQKNASAIEEGKTDNDIKAREKKKMSLQKCEIVNENARNLQCVPEEASYDNVAFHFDYFKDHREIFPDVLFEAMRFLKDDEKKFNENIVAEYDANDRKLIFIFLDEMYRIALEYANKKEMNTAQKRLQNGPSSDKLLYSVENAINELHKEAVMKNFVVYLENTNSDFVKSQDISKLLTAVFELGEVHKLYEQATAEPSTSSKIVPTTSEQPMENCNKKEDIVKKDKKEPLKQQNEKTGLVIYLKTAMKLNAYPVFSLICLCRALHFITFNPVLTAVVDFCMDRGFPEDYGKYIIAALSAGDLIGRLCCGWITDKGYISLPGYMTIAMLLQGATTVYLPFIIVKWQILATIALFGMLEGSIYVRHPVLISKYIKREDQAIAMGCLNFLTGIIGFGVPSYIGYFRDTLGAYDRMFYITGSMGGIIGLAWLFEPYLLKWTSYQKEEKIENNKKQLAK